MSVPHAGRGARATDLDSVVIQHALRKLKQELRAQEHQPCLNAAVRLSQVYGEALGRPGHVPGIEPGAVFTDRSQLILTGLHGDYKEMTWCIRTDPNETNIVQDTHTVVSLVLDHIPGILDDWPAIPGPAALPSGFVPPSGQSFAPASGEEDDEGGNDLLPGQPQWKWTVKAAKPPKNQVAVEGAAPREPSLWVKGFPVRLPDGTRSNLRGSLARLLATHEVRQPVRVIRVAWVPTFPGLPHSKAVRAARAAQPPVPHAGNKPLLASTVVHDVYTKIYIYMGMYIVGSPGREKPNQSRYFRLDGVEGQHLKTADLCTLVDKYVVGSSPLAVSYQQFLRRPLLPPASRPAAPGGTPGSAPPAARGKPAVPPPTHVTGAGEAGKGAGKRRRASEPGSSAAAAVAAAGGDHPAPAPAPGSHATTVTPKPGADGGKRMAKRPKRGSVGAVDAPVTVEGAEGPALGARRGSVGERRGSQGAGASDGAAVSLSLGVGVGAGTGGCSGATGSGAVRAAAGADDDAAGAAAAGAGGPEGGDVVLSPRATPAIVEVSARGGAGTGLATHGADFTTGLSPRAAAGLPSPDRMFLDGDDGRGPLDSGLPLEGGPTGSDFRVADLLDDHAPPSRLATPSPAPSTGEDAKAPLPAPLSGAAATAVTTADGGPRAPTAATAATTATAATRAGGAAQGPVPPAFVKLSAEAEQRGIEAWLVNLALRDPLIADLSHGTAHLPVPVIVDSPAAASAPLADGTPSAAAPTPGGAEGGGSAVGGGRGKAGEEARARAQLEFKYVPDYVWAEGVLEEVWPVLAHEETVLRGAAGQPDATADAAAAAAAAGIADAGEHTSMAAQAQQWWQEGRHRPFCGARYHAALLHKANAAGVAGTGGKQPSGGGAAAGGSSNSNAAAPVPLVPETEAEIKAQVKAIARVHVVDTQGCVSAADPPLPVLHVCNQGCRRSRQMCEDIQKVLEVPTLPLEVFRLPTAGQNEHWGVRCALPIPKGRVVCMMVGQLTTPARVAGVPASPQLVLHMSHVTSLWQWALGTGLSRVDPPLQLSDIPPPPATCPWLTGPVTELALNQPGATLPTTAAVRAGARQGHSAAPATGPPAALNSPGRVGGGGAPGTDARAKLAGVWQKAATGSEEATGKDWEGPPGLLALDMRTHGNVARLIRHANMPNLELRVVYAGGARSAALYYQVLCAVRDIGAGEELTRNHFNNAWLPAQPAPSGAKPA